jgi:hypothetical protein
LKALFGRPWLRAICATATLALAVAGTVARASNYSLYLEPGYLYSVSDVDDRTGRPIHIERQAILQNYRLAVDLDLWRNLILSGAGTFLDTSNWVTTNGVPLRFDQPAMLLFGRLTYSTPLLSAGLQYDYNQQWGTLLRSSQASETATAYANWRPMELPQFDFRLSRSHNWDVSGDGIDSITTTALAGLRYSFRAFDLRYYFNWIDSQDRTYGVSTSAIDQMAQGTYSDTYFNNRVSAYLNALFTARSLAVTSIGPDGTVAQQQFPITGLSVVEAFPATPTEVTLAPNPALIDGNVLASAGVNIGFGPSLAGDRSLRNVGVGFADANTPVNMVYLWVDRKLPPEVVTAFASSFSAYASSDNVRWTPITISAPVVFGAFNNRFEIAIPVTGARYVKVITAPLLPGVTSDRAYSEIFVTELQTFNVVSAGALPPTVSSYGVQANATFKVAILRAPNLDYDLSAFFNRQSVSGFQSYTVVNGLNLNARLSRVWGIMGRAARQDSDPGSGHETQWQWSASLVARPLPTLYGALTYSGQRNDFADRLTDPPTPVTTILQSLTLFGRADVYEGVSFQASIGGTNNIDMNQRANTGVNGTATLALVPNQWISLTTTYNYAMVWSSGGFLPDAAAETARINATLILTPIPALSASATADWLITGVRPALYATFQLNYSPLKGDLQFGFAYARTLDTASEVVTQYISPSLRWTIRPGVFLNAAYNFNDSDGPVLSIRTRVLNTSLIIIL